MNLTYKAEVLDRFPREDHDNAEFMENLEMFAFPMGVRLSRQLDSTDCFSFILTEQDGTRVFGSALIFYELLDPKLAKTLTSQTELDLSTLSPTSQTRSLSEPDVPEEVDAQDDEVPSGKPKHSRRLSARGSLMTVYAPKALVMTSHWPFTNQMERFLTALHEQTTNGSLKVPVERVLNNFIFEVPLPPPGRLVVDWRGLEAFEAPNKPLTFARPPPNKKPLNTFDVSVLFRCLSPSNIMLLFSAVLTEKRVVLVSSHLSRLTTCAECICDLLCPLIWTQVYIPILPQRLVDYVLAPMPYLVGVHESYLPTEELLEGVVIVKLDQNLICTVGEAPIPEFTDKCYNRIMKGLRKLMPDVNHTLPADMSLDKEAVDAIFLRWFVKLLKDYRNFIEPPSEFVVDRFDKNGFAKQHPDRGPLLMDLMETQQFQCFVDERYGDAAENENLAVLFFDESIDAYLGKPTPFLSDISLHHQEENRVMALPPSAKDIPAEEDVRAALQEQRKHNQATARAAAVARGDEEAAEDGEEAADDSGDLFVPSGPPYRYGLFPHLCDVLAGKPRPVKTLVAEGDIEVVGSRHARGDMSGLSMKFFTEKRLYSQHFHSLRIRSTKQDLLFNDVATFYRFAQQFDEESAQGLERVCARTVDRESLETGTSVDGAWAALRMHIGNMSDQLVDTLRTVREETCGPLYAAASSAEHQLKILFREATKLEEKASKGKNIVERAAQRAAQMQKRYEALRESFGKRALTSSEITRLVTYQSEAENAELESDEADTTFRTTLLEYETRMPQIIETIRELNSHRIKTLKKSMEAYCHARIKQLQSEQDTMGKLLEAVECIDVQADLASFSKGTTDFWNIGGRLAAPSVAPHAAEANAEATPAAEEATPVPEALQVDTSASTSGRKSVTLAPQTPPPGTTDSPHSSAGSATATGGSANDAKDAPKPIITRASTGSVTQDDLAVTRTGSRTTLGGGDSAPHRMAAGRLSQGYVPRALLSFPLHLWGGHGFEAAQQRSLDTKRMFKSLFLCLDTWADVVDARERRLFQVVKTTINGSMLREPSEHQSWLTLVEASRESAKSGHELVKAVRVLTSNLRVTKGELKQSMKRYADHKAKLDAELAAANTRVQRALEKRVRAKASLDLVEKESRSSVAAAASHLELERHQMRIDRASREFKAADHTYVYEDRERGATQDKHDVCISRLLSLLEKKQAQCGRVLRRAMESVTLWCTEVYDEQMSRLWTNVMTGADNLDPVADRRAFLRGAHPLGSQGVATLENEPENRSKGGLAQEGLLARTVMGLNNGFELLSKLTKRGENNVKVFITWCEDYAELLEAEIKSLRKAKAVFVMKSCPTQQSINSAMRQLTMFLQGLTAVLGTLHKGIRNDVLLQLQHLRGTIKSTIKRNNSDFAEAEKQLERAITAQERAEAEETKCRTTLEEERQQLESVRQGDESGSRVRIGLMAKVRRQSPEQVMEARVAAAEKALEQATAVREHKDQTLTEVRESHHNIVQDLLLEMEQFEQGRQESIAALLKSTSSLHLSFHNKLSGLLKQMATKVNEIDVNRDLQMFIANSRTDFAPPASVLEDFERRTDADALRASEEREKEESEKITRLLSTDTSSMHIVARTKPEREESAPPPLIKSNSHSVLDNIPVPAMPPPAIPVPDMPPPAPPQAAQKAAVKEEEEDDDEDDEAKEETEPEAAQSEAVPEPAPSAVDEPSRSETPLIKNLADVDSSDDELPPADSEPEPLEAADTDSDGEAAGPVQLPPQAKPQKVALPSMAPPLPPLPPKQQSNKE